MAPLRVSAISFLNTAPLIWDFEHGAAGSDFDVSFTLPSACAEALRTGAADIGIIPVIAYSTIPGLVVLPDVSIASKRSVRSILLVSKVPFEEIETVAADTSSRTSVALARVLFCKWFGGPRRFTPMEPNLDSMLAQCDAALLIGDPALTVDRTRYLTYDLAEEWHRSTGKPMVFAFWAARAEVAHSGLARVFRDSRDHGLQPENLHAIARQWAPRVGISEGDVISYLTQNIDYSLDAENLEGLDLFYRYATDCGIIAAPRPLEFVGQKQLLTTDQGI
ncbi:MAG: menaquinone biosynthetic enzyme MqnA/MqnD family protein [Terriglobales bacterium]